MDLSAAFRPSTSFATDFFSPGSSSDSVPEIELVSPGKQGRKTSFLLLHIEIFFSQPFSAQVGSY
jgi:hypothetical protein